MVLDPFSKRPYCLGMKTTTNTGAAMATKYAAFAKVDGLTEVAQYARAYWRPTPSQKDMIGRLATAKHVDVVVDGDFWVIPGVCS